MKGLGLLILWLSVMIGDVRANDNSIAFELLHYYYAYKINWQAGTPKKLAPECQPSDIAEGTALAAAKVEQGLVGICAFDEFVKHVMEKDWLKNYTPDPTTDHVIDPDVNAAKTINAVNSKSARYNVAALSDDFKKKVPIQEVLDYTNTVIQGARKTGKVPQTSVDKAVQMLTIVQQYRKSYLYPQLNKDIIKKFGPLAPYIASKTDTIADGSGPDGAGTTYTDYDADKTLANIDAALQAKTLTDAKQKTDLKNYVKGYGRYSKGGTTDFRVSHMRIIRKAKNVLDELALPVAVEETLPECKAA